jgi:geranylgeranyl diphosphate synthase type II
MTLSDYLAARRREIGAALDRLLRPETASPEAIHRAMRYSVFAGGKRLRPLLVLLASDLCGGRRELALPPACAVEMVHTYSLIHDDLPAMDNDDLRRGRPSCHRAFDEATAILAGDALLTLAFEVLACPPCEGHAAALVAELARAAGAAGMAAGQMCDMSLTGTEPTAEAVDFIHRHKTAALMAAALRLGAIVADAPDVVRARLGRFGELLGLAFQITDDALDVELPSELLGKTAGKDASEGKITYPAVFGLAESRRRAAELTEQAIAELEPFGPSADLLRELARWLASRKA